MIVGTRGVEFDKEKRKLYYKNNSFDLKGSKPRTLIQDYEIILHKETLKLIPKEVKQSYHTKSIGRFVEFSKLKGESLLYDRGKVNMKRTGEYVVLWSPAVSTDVFGEREIKEIFKHLPKCFKVKEIFNEWQGFFVTLEYDIAEDDDYMKYVENEAEKFALEINSAESSIEGDFFISDDEWKKTLEYLDKGSDMSRVAKACKDNVTKLLSRYLILLEIGEKSEASIFEAYLNDKGYDNDYLKGFRAKFVKEIPVKWQKVIDQYKNGTGKIATAENGGKNSDTAWTMKPLAILKQMGINYTVFYMDQSDDKKGICAKYNIPKVKLDKSAYWHDSQNGRCYTIGYVVVMYNGHVSEGWHNYFWFVSHTCESGDSCYGYDVGFKPDYVNCGSGELSSKVIQKRIVENVTKDEEKPIDYSYKEEPKSTAPTTSVTPDKNAMGIWFEKPGIGYYCKYQSWMKNEIFFDNETDAEIYIANNCSGYSGKPSDIIKLILKASGPVSFGGPKNKSEMSTGGELKRAGLKDWARSDFGSMSITDVLEQLDFALEGKRIGVMGRKNTTYFFFNDRGEFFAEDQYGKMKVKKEADAWEFVKRIAKSVLKA